AGHQQTTLRGVVCTPGYAPIEQYLATTALNLTPAVDLYALGVLLYETLAGYHPFLNWSRGAQHVPAAVPPVESMVVEDGASGSAMRSEGLFTAQTERHTVPDDMLRHLQSIVTGGVTWRSTLDDNTPYVTAASGPFVTAATRPMSTQAAWEQDGEHSGWTRSDTRPPAAGSTRTMQRVEVERLGASNDVVAAGERAGEVTRERRVPKGEVPRRFSVIEVLALQQKVKPRSIDGIPPKLNVLVSQLLAKRPSERPQSAREVAERLRALLPRLQEAPAEFAASTPKNNSRYLARALLWIRLRQNAAQWAWAAAGLIVAGSTGAGVYHGMTASS